MITTVDEAVRKIFEIYFQRSADPELHENCVGCKKALSLEEMEIDLKYQERLIKMFDAKIKHKFSDPDIIFIANQLSNPLVSEFMRLALSFCNEDAEELRRFVFGDSNDENDERRII